jgi:hypothetical protein
LYSNTCTPNASSFPKVKLTWTGNKTDLIELIYALDMEGSFNDGKVPLTQIAAYFERVFNIDLGNNIPRNFYDMRSAHAIPRPTARDNAKRMDNTKPGKYKDPDKDKGKK